MRTERGYSPLTLPDPLLQALTPTLRKEWTTISRAHDRWKQERDSISVLRIAAQQAPQRDEAAAREAVQNGTPIPAATVHDANTALAQKEREVTALADLLDAQERSFFAAFLQQQDALTPVMREHLQQRVRVAMDALTTFRDAQAEAALYGALWGWCRQHSTTVPTSRGVRVVVDLGGYTQDVDHVAQMIGDQITEQDPDAVEQREADRAALIAQQQGLPQTPDGLLIDHGLRYGRG